MCDYHIIEDFAPDDGSRPHASKRSLPDSFENSIAKKAQLSNDAPPSSGPLSNVSNTVNQLTTARKQSVHSKQPAVAPHFSVDFHDIHTLMKLKSDKTVIVDIDGRHQKFRRVLVDWLCEAGDSFKFEKITIHCAVQYLDRVLSTVAIERNMLQLVALCCLIVSAKFEEIDINLPNMRRFRSLVFSQYDSVLISQMEKLVLDKLNWSLHIVTPLHFVEYYLVKGCLFTDDIMCNGKPVGRSMSRSYKKYCRFFADVILQEAQFQGHKPIILACCIMRASRKALKITPEWRDELSKLTQTSEEAFLPVLTALYAYYECTYPGATEQANDKENQERSSPKGVAELFVA